MINQLLRRFSVKHRIAAVLLLLTLTLLISVPLIIINQKFLIGRLNEITDVEMRAERLLLMASTRLFESRANLARYTERFTLTTQDAQNDILAATDYILEARDLTDDPNEISTMDQLLDDLYQYHGLVLSIKEKEGSASSLSFMHAQVFALSDNLSQRAQQLADSSRQRVVTINQALEQEAENRLVTLIIRYCLLLFACFLFMFFIGGSIIQPINALHHWVLNFQMGQLSPPLPSKGRDELARLAQTLNTLTARLSSSHFDLERKVAESTDRVSSTRAKLVEESLIRQQIQQQLAERELQYGAIFEHVTDGIMIARDGRMQYVNPQFAEIFGYVEDELLGTVFENYVITNDRDLLKKQIPHNDSASSRSNRIEVTAVHYSGTLIDLELNSGLINYEGTSSVLWIARDITARKQAAQSLEITQFMVDSASDAIYRALPSGEIDYANQVACNWLGYKQNELPSITAYDVLPYLSREKWEAHLTRLKQTGRLSFEWSHLTKSGKAFPIEVRTSYREFNGQEYVFGFVRNIAQRKKVEEELQKAKEVAVAASEAKSQFLSSVTHELRTPMNGVLGMTSLLYDTPLDSEQLEIVNTIRNSGDTLLNIINEVLDFSKLDAGKIELEMTKFDLRQNIEETIDLVALSAAKKGINLVYLLNESVPRYIVQDVTRVRQILANLLSNAIKFTEEGEVVIIVSAVPLTGDEEALKSLALEQSTALTKTGIAVSNAKIQPLELIVAVKDTGIGIPTDRLDRLFRSFSQVDASTTRRFGGTGLGLAISKNLAKAMGGTMWVESQAGVGSTFYFSIITATEDDSDEDWLIEQVGLYNKRFIVCVQSKNTERAVVQYLNSWQTESVIVPSPDVVLAKLQKSDAVILDAATFTEVQADERFSQLDNVPIVLLASMIKPKAAYESYPNITPLSTPLRASQLQDALMTAINKDTSQSITPQDLYTSMNVSSTKNTQKVEQFPIATKVADPIGDHRHPLKILLAEDNLVNQKVALGILRKLGYRADVAANGQEVLEALERQDYEIILMDISMPIMDGIMATTAIREEFSAEKQPYIVAVTANAMPGDREKYMEIGMNDYVSKPIQIDMLRDALDRFQQDMKVTAVAA